MRKSALFALVALATLLASCEKDPDTDKLDNDYLVYTNYDAKSDFSSFESVYVIDSILIIGNSDKAAYWKNDNSQKVVDAFIDNLMAKGYILAGNPLDADLVLQLSYINNTYYFNNYNGPWWNTYPGYWNWGGWGWYYPYPIYYSFSTGSIIGELVDNTGPSAAASNKLTVVWNCYICGLLNGSSLSLSRTMEGIDQAFKQSPYLNK